MKVLYITDIYEIGGAVQSFLEMTSTLKSVYGVEPIIVVSKKGKVSERCRIEGNECHIAKYRQFYVNAGSTIPRQIIRKIFKPYLLLRYIIGNKIAINILKKEVDFSTIDIIHSNTERNDIGAILSKEYGIPHVWHIRVFGEPDYGCFSLKSKYIDFMNRNADKFICISKAEQEYWVKKGLTSNKSIVIYNGIDSDKYSSTHQFNEEGNLKIVIAGFISPKKGQIQAIEALAKLRNEYGYRVTLDLYGTGAKEYIISLKNIIKKSNLVNEIRFMGQANNLPEKLINYDVGLMCSEAEAFGRVTIEYMMSGLCVIASDAGANPEIIKSNYNGFLYQHGDVNDLKNKLKFVIDNKKKIISIGKNAKKCAFEKYTKYENAKNIRKLYEEVIKR